MIAVLPVSVAVESVSVVSVVVVRATAVVPVLVEVVEPYLLRLGFLQRTPTGRKATYRAYQHLGMSLPGAGGGQSPLEM